jgi:hypothetical protein
MTYSRIAPLLFIGALTQGCTGEPVGIVKVDPVSTQLVQSVVVDKANQCKLVAVLSVKEANDTGLAGKYGSRIQNRFIDQASQVPGRTYSISTEYRAIPIEQFMPGGDFVSDRKIMSDLQSKGIDCLLSGTFWLSNGVCETTLKLHRFPSMQLISSETNAYTKSWYSNQSVSQQEFCK